MKKIILLIGLTLLSISSFNAQSLAGYKICINPGHGGHDSNDREIPLAPGITFWESEGNLTKGLYLKTMLESLGATVFMSRITNNTADDLPLSQIVAIANTNNVDYFHAVHSNATGTAIKVNYTLLLYRGWDQIPSFARAKEMGSILARNIRLVNRTTAESNRGDSSFYKDHPTIKGLGVLRGLTMPGTLSEGSFHDYTPETWRLKNESYLKHEAWAIARSFMQYFNGGSFKNGIVAGIVRDLLERVPASYNPLSGTNDNYKPINKVKVKLEPGGKIYTGDELNNGYYFFDEVVPGNYKLIFEIDKIRPDTVALIAKANESVFNDRLLTINPILDPPKIISFAPSDSINEVSNVSPVIIDFDIRMSATETQNAFSIAPAVAGSIQWDTDSKKLTFTPTKSYVPGSKYLVTISTSAKTHFGIYLQQKKSFSFTTRSKLNLVSTYPRSGLSNISTTVLMRLSFDKGIDASTLVQKISVADSLGNLLSLTANQTKYNLGIIEFESRVPLSNNTLYRITVREGIGDVEYVKFPQTTTIEFRTEKNLTFIGNILEGFETDNVWQSPLLSSNTIGVISSQTNFSILSQRIKNGEKSGRLDYTFSGKDGIIELALINPIALSGSSSTEFGLWIFGDDSNNILEYRFIRQSSNVEKVMIDTINWTGWKMKKILLSQIPGSGSIQFKSINVLQSNSGSLSGRIFFDECIGNIITDVNKGNESPNEFQLAQNYPNPFNPSTTISYQISTFSQVTLKVYDLLGREVATLVNEDKEPGKHVVNFNAKGLASGIYIYRIQAGNFAASKKLLLLK